MAINGYKCFAASILLLFCFQLSLAQVKDPALTFKWVKCPDCPFPDADTSYLRKAGIFFGYLDVPENRLNYSGRRLQLAVEVMKAFDSMANKPPIVILHGGPGGRVVGNMSWQYDALQKDHTIILIDQRGCGFSDPPMSEDLNRQLLNMFSRDMTPEQERTEMVRILSAAKDSLVKSGVDLSAYNSSAIAADINDLCSILGYRSYYLWGASYGTRIALTLMKEFPDRIKGVVLESPLPPNARYFEEITSNFKKSLFTLFEKCANDLACSQSYPHLKDDFKAAITSLEREPLVVNMPDRSKYPDGKFIINAQDMLLGLQQALYNSNSYSIIPLLIEAVKQRNETAICSFADMLANNIYRLHYQTYYAVTSIDCMSFNNVKTFEDSSKGFWNGLAFYKDQFSIADVLNPQQSFKGDSAAVQSEIPALILSGEMDPIASSTYGDLIKTSLPKAFLYKFQNTGHVIVANENSFGIVQSFFEHPEKQPVAGNTVKNGDIHFANKVRIENGIITLAPKLQFNKKNYLYIGWLFLSFILSVISMIVAIRRLRIKKYRLVLVNALLGIIFPALLILFILKTLRQNYLILGFGLPQNYAYILLIPYLIIALFVAQSVFVFTQKDKKLKVFFYLIALQIPLILFITYFQLFY